MAIKNVGKNFKVDMEGGEIYEAFSGAKNRTL